MLYGSNWCGPRDWEPGWFANDLMRHARPFVNGVSYLGWDRKLPPCTFEVTGGTAMFVAQDGRAMGSDLTTISFAGGTGVQIRKMSGDPTITAKANNDDGYFNSMFLLEAHKYGIIRTMDLQKTIGNRKRSVVDYTESFEDAMSPSELRALRLALHKPTWHCIPMDAEDQLCLDIARAAEANQHQLCVIELGNEHWNSGSRAMYAYFMSHGEHYMNNPDTQGFDAVHDGYANRLSHVARVIKENLGHLKNIRIVMGAQNANPWWTRQTIERMKVHGGWEHIDAIAVAPYYGEVGENLAIDWNTDPIASIDKYAGRRFEEHAEIAKGEGRHLYCYEGGQHYVDYGNPQQIIDYNYNGASIGVHYDYFHEAIESGLRAHGLFDDAIFCHFNAITHPGPHGSWGAIRSYEDSKTPLAKYRAIMRAIGRFNRGHHPADINKDGVVDKGDIDSYVKLFLGADPRADINEDGVIDNGDIHAFVKSFQSFKIR